MLFRSQAAIAGPLLASQSALILNNRTGEVLYQKNMNRVMPIASISKLMSAMVVLDARLNMNEVITITEDEIDRLKGTGSEHLNHGVVHFDALGIGHIQRDFRAGVADVVEQQPAAGEEGDERDEPHHKGKTAVAADFCLWFACGRMFIHCVILRFM